MVIVSSLCRHEDAFAKCYVPRTEMSKVQDTLVPMVFIIFGRRCLQAAFFMSEGWQPQLQINLDVILTRVQLTKQEEGVATKWDPLSNFSDFPNVTFRIARTKKETDLNCISGSLTASTKQSFQKADNCSFHQSLVRRPWPVRLNEGEMAWKTSWAPSIPAWPLRSRPSSWLAFLLPSSLCQSILHPPARAQLYRASIWSSYSLVWNTARASHHRCNKPEHLPKAPG